MQDTAVRTLVAVRSQTLAAQQPAYTLCILPNVFCSPEAELAVRVFEVLSVAGGLVRLTSHHLSTFSCRKLR
jgi:hypothetical protein